MGLCPIAPPKGFPIALWKPSDPICLQQASKVIRFLPIRKQPTKKPE